jgi:hypothetical protein
MGKKLLFILLILTFPHFSLAKSKLPRPLSKEIISFSLFNYDNLIADSYESDKKYIEHLSYLLFSATNIDQSSYKSILNGIELREESSPIKYLMKLNRMTANISGYYFVDE